MIKSVITTEQTKKMFTSDFATRDNQFKLTSIAIKKPAQFVCSKGMTQLCILIAKVLKYSNEFYFVFDQPFEKIHSFVVILMILDLDLH